MDIPDDCFVIYQGNTTVYYVSLSWDQQLVFWILKFAVGIDQWMPLNNPLAPEVPWSPVMGEKVAEESAQCMESGHGQMLQNKITLINFGTISHAST